MTTTSGNPLLDWSLDRENIRTVGCNLHRPECILAERDGSLWAADARGGITHLRPDGSQALIAQVPDGRFDLAKSVHDQYTTGTLPNGLAFTKEGDFLVANFGTDCLELMSRKGVVKTICNSLDGKPVGKVNFVLRDSRDRVWVTVSTTVNPWVSAMNPDIHDGYIAILEGNRLRLVAEGFSFTNEIRLDAKEEWMYVVETTGKRITRLRLMDDGSLANREVYGPSSLGTGFPDGLAFDAFGNLWVTMIMADRLIAITPQGDVLSLFDDGNVDATNALEHNFEAGTLTTEIMAAAKGSVAPWMASVTFGGHDLRTVYLGSLMGSTIPFFRSPVAGLPMVHWNEQ